MIEQVLVDPTAPINPAVELNCVRSADLDLAVGLNRIVYTSNCKVRVVDPVAPGVALDEVYLRNHQEDNPLDPVGLFSPSLHPGPQFSGGSRFADPRVHWDVRNQRFWIIAIEHAPDRPPFTSLWDVGWIHVAVSKTSSPNNMRSGPTGDWFTFVFDTRVDFVPPIEGIPDRPTVDTDGQTLIIAVGRELADPAVVPLRNMRSVLISIPTTNLLAGVPPTLPIWNLKLDPNHPDVTEDTAFHCAARTYDALPVPRTKYFLATNVHPYTIGNPVYDGLVIGQLDPYGAGLWKYSSQVLTLPFAAWYYTAPFPLAPPPTGKVAAQGGPIFWSVVERAGSLWAVHSILRNLGTINEPSPDPSGRTIARWYEIIIGDTGGFTLAQWGDIDPEIIYSVPALESFDPSISVNALGDLAITYTISGANTYPSFAMARRYRTSPTNTLPYHTIVRSGVDVLDHTNYWSDFSGTEVDQTGCFFWAHSLEAYDDGVTPTDPADRYQSWTARLNLCTDDMWADFDGDAKLTIYDWIEFTSLQRSADRRADVNRDKRHDIVDFEKVAEALKGVR